MLGSALALTVNDPKCTAILRPPLESLLFPRGGSTTSTSTWWDRFPPLTGLPTSSPWSTGRPAGLKLFPSPRRLARAFNGTSVARFGTPSDLSSDRGPQLTSELWNAVAEGLGVKLHRTTAYHPQANGLCERFHRSMKAALRASLKDGDWVDRLPWVMLGLRCAPKEDLRSSSAELVYGQALQIGRAHV